MRFRDFLNESNSKPKQLRRLSITESDKIVFHRNRLNEQTNFAKNYIEDMISNVCKGLKTIYSINIDSNKILNQIDIEETNDNDVYVVTYNGKEFKIDVSSNSNYTDLANAIVKDINKSISIEGVKLYVTDMSDYSRYECPRKCIEIETDVDRNLSRYCFYVKDVYDHENQFDCDGRMYDSMDRIKNLSLREFKQDLLDFDIDNFDELCTKLDISPKDFKDALFKDTYEENDIFDSDLDYWNETKEIIERELYERKLNNRIAVYTYEGKRWYYCNLMPLLFSDDYEDVCILARKTPTEKEIQDFNNFLEVMRDDYFSRLYYDSLWSQLNIDVNDDKEVAHFLAKHPNVNKLVN